MIIRRQVAGRVVHFVSSCSLTVRSVTQPPVPAALPMTICPSAVTLAMGQPTLEVRYVLQAGMSEVATADLGAAFEQVANCRGLGDAIPVIGLPAEGMAQRPTAGLGSATRPQRTMSAP